MLKFYHIMLPGAVVLQPINRFDRVDRPSAIRHLECNGSEDHISQCSNINTEILNTCGRYEVAGVVCQSMNRAMIFVRFVCVY